MSQIAQTGEHEHILGSLLKPWIRASGCRRKVTFPTVSLPVRVTEVAKCSFSSCSKSYFLLEGSWFSCSSWAVQYRFQKIVWALRLLCILIIPTQGPPVRFFQSFELYHSQLKAQSEPWGETTSSDCLRSRRNFDVYLLSQHGWDV